MTRRFLALGLATAVLMLGGMNARAETVTLDSLLKSGASIEVSGNGFDLVFSGFEYKTTGSSMPAATDVNVTPRFLTGSAGLEFQGGFGSPLGTTSDSLITYTVTSKAGAITDAHLIGNPTVSPNTNQGFMGVTETLTPDRGPTAQMAIFDSEPTPPGGLKTSDQVLTLDATSIIVNKDIFAQSVTGVPSLSFVDQTYSTTVIPEPTSLALLGLGLTGLFTFRRFFKRAFVA